jgi:hypothetical protein
MGSQNERALSPPFAGLLHTDDTTGPPEKHRQTAKTFAKIHEKGRCCMRLRLARLAWPLLVLLVLVGAAVLLIRGWPRVMPPIHGRVLDARSGTPIPDFLVERKLFEKGPPDLVDSRTGDFVRGSFVKVTTDKDGRFELPAAFVWGLSGMAWFAYKPGWMPGFGCYQQRGWSDGACGGLTAIVPDPFVMSSFERRALRIDMELRVFPPTLEGVTLLTFDARVGKFVPRPPDARDDPWANYFQRMNTAVQDHYIEPEVFVKEANDFAATHQLNWALLTQFAQVRGLLAYQQDNGTYFKPDQALQLLALEEQYCSQHQEDKRCMTSILARDRVWLEEKVAANKKK